MKLMTEVIDDGLKYLCEEKEGKKNYFLEGTFMQSEVKNRNGRVYPKSILAKEAVRYQRDYIDKNRAYGELGHPQGPTINLERVSHMIKELKEIEQKNGTFTFDRNPNLYYYPIPKISITVTNFLERIKILKQPILKP